MKALGALQSPSLYRGFIHTYGHFSLFLLLTLSYPQDILGTTIDSDKLIYICQLQADHIQKETVCQPFNLKTSALQEA